MVLCNLPVNFSLGILIHEGLREFFLQDLHGSSEPAPDLGAGEDGSLMQGKWVELICHFLAHRLYPGCHSVFSCAVLPLWPPQQLSMLATTDDGS